MVKAKLFVLARRLEVLLLHPDGDMSTEARDMPVGEFLDKIEKQIGQPLDIISTITPDTYILSKDQELIDLHFQVTGLHRRIIAGVLRRRGIKPTRPKPQRLKRWTPEQAMMEKLKHKEFVGHVVTFLPRKGEERISGVIKNLRIEPKVRMCYFNIQAMGDKKMYLKSVHDPSIKIDKAATLLLMRSKCASKIRRKEEQEAKRQAIREEKRALRKQMAMTRQQAISLAAEGQLRKGKIVCFPDLQGNMIYGRVHGSRVINGYPYYSIYDLDGRNHFRSMRNDNLVWGEPPYAVKKRFEALDLKKAKERLEKNLLSKL